MSDKDIKETEERIEETSTVTEEVHSTNNENKETNEELENKELMEKFQFIMEAQQKQYEEKILNLKREQALALEQQKKQYSLEIEGAKNFVLQKFAQDILLVGDALKAGIDANPDNYNKFIDGIKMTHNIFLSTLEKYNIKLITVELGNEFDEKFHECLGMDGDGNSIVQILNTGYIYNDRVLRPVQVLVGAKKS